MTLLFMLALVGIGYYLLLRRGRGADQPTIREDLKSLFSFKRSVESRPNLEEGFEPRQKPGRKPSKLYESRDREVNHDLSEADRHKEIMGLNELWNQSTQAEAQRKEDQ